MAGTAKSGEVRKRGSRRGGKGPTIADVARAAGVSPMTVSRVVNKEPIVGEETRARVLATIAQLGYVPNLAARALAGGQQLRLALLHDNPSAAWLSEVLVACLTEASQNDAQLLVERCENRHETAEIVRHLVSHRIDGAILPPPLADDLRLLDALDRAGIVRVQLAPGIAAPTADAVGIDDRAAAREMARHLIALGHRRIGFITGDDALAASPLRLEGYRAALDEAGIPVDPAFVAAGDFSYRSGFEAAMRLLGLPDRPTAIFAANDDMAAAVVAAAHRQRLDVPHDVSVCGFDDTAMATMIWPQLTTVRQPIAAIAATATLLLIDALRSKAAGEPRAPHHRLLPFTLVTRESDGPPELSASQPPIAKELPR